MIVAEKRRLQDEKIIKKNLKKIVSKTGYRKIWDSEEWKIKRQLLLIKVGNKCQWCDNTNYLQMAHISERTWEDYTDKEYLETDEVLILCRKCHYAKAHGKLKCPDCEGYMVDNGYDSCYNCNFVSPEEYYR